VIYKSFIHKSILEGSMWVDGDDGWYAFHVRVFAKAMTVTRTAPRNEEWIGGKTWGWDARGYEKAPLSVSHFPPTGHGA
jgi:hypothetical protein